MLDIKDYIKQEADKLYPELVNIRNHIHSNPELSFEEYQTQKYVSNILQNWGIDSQPIANTGLFGFVSGNSKQIGKTIGVRAELDALPIYEKNDKPYKSQNEGIMHACGHDVHITCLLGAIKILSQISDKLSGSLKFIFQPGEEKLPGGASLLIKDNILEGVDAILSLHILPELEVGNVGFREGMYMASTDEIYISILGKGGHGAMPHHTTDTVLIGSQLVVSLQQIVSRLINPTIPAVLSIGKFIANGATNVIPSEVFLEGTCRTFDEQIRAQIHQNIYNITEGLAQTFGVKIEVKIIHGYPSLFNNALLTQSMGSFATQYLGSEHITELPLRTTADDFAFYTQYIPSCYYRLGVGNKEKNIVHGVHHPQFDIDEEALKIGSGLLAYQIWNYLNGDESI